MSRADIVHEAYLMALRDEREILTRARADGEDIPSLARAMLETCERMAKQGYGGDMAHYVRGSRDFWRNQVKLATKPA